MNKFSCKICDDFSTNHYYDIIRHLTKKKSCMRSIKSHDYSNDQLLVLTLLNNELKLNLDHLDKSNILFDNKTTLLSLVKTIDKNKLKKCTLCNLEYTKICDLRYHLISNCLYYNLKKNIPDDSDNKINININNSIDSNNVINNITHNNITNNITTNIYLDIKNPVPFDENWDVTKIDDIFKESLIFSKFMYTRLLLEILKNEINLNVIIEENNDSGIVYKNDIDKYIKMKSEDIVDKTIQKLKEQLLDINDRCANNCVDDCLKSSKINIIKKYENYVDKIEIKDKVSQLIKDIYNTKKDDALSLCKNICKDNIIEY